MSLEQDNSWMRSGVFRRFSESLMLDTLAKNPYARELLEAKDFTQLYFIFCLEKGRATFQERVEDLRGIKSEIVGPLAKEIYTQDWDDSAKDLARNMIDEVFYKTVKAIRAYHNIKE